MKRIFLLANLCLAFGLTAPRILFAESGLIFDQTQGTLYGQLNVPTTATAGLTVSSSVYLAVSGGNVGIGTANPGSLLHIVGGDVKIGLNAYGTSDAPAISGGTIERRLNIFSASNSPAISLEYYSSGYGLDIWAGTTGLSPIYFDQRNNDALVFRTKTASAPAEAMRITGAGNVGIGTTAPASALQIGSTASGNSRIGGGSYSEYWITEAYPRVFLSRDGAASGVAALQFGVGATPVDTTIQRLPSGPGVALMGGNVGIGTTSPGAKLDIRGGGINVGVSGDNNYMNLFGTWRTQSTAAGLWDETMVGENLAFHYYTGSSWLTNRLLLSSTGISSAGTLTISGTGNSSIAGNVGIGTTGPNQKLEVGGNGGLGFSGTGLNSADKKLYSPADGDLEWMTANAAGVHGFAVSNLGTKLVYLNTSGNSYFNGGNVGIGTTGPVDILDVQKNQNATTNFYFRNTNNTNSSSRAYLNLIAGNQTLAFAALANNGGSYIGGTAGTSMYFQQNLGGAINMTIDPNGNVGIGTTSPAAKLEVNGSIKVTSRIVNWQSACISGNICGGGTLTSTVLSGADYGQIYNGTARVSLRAYAGDACTYYFYTLYPTVTARDSPQELYLGASPNPCPTGSYVVQVSY